MSNVKTEINDAIALAKAVRTTALENARVALTERFSENYKALFAEKLKKEATERQTTAGTDRTNLPAEDALKESDIDELIKELESDIEGADASSTPTDVDPSADVDASAGLDGNEGAPEAAVTATPAPEGVTAPPGTAVVQAPVIVVSPETAPDGGEGEVGMEPDSELPPTDGAGASEEDVNLDELLESLKQEIDDEENDKEDECINEDTTLDSSGIAGAPGKSNKPTAAASSSSKIETNKNVHHGIPDGEIKECDPTKAKRPNAGPVNKNKMSTPALTKESKAHTDVKVGFPDAGTNKTLNKAGDPTESERPNEGPVNKNNMETSKLKEALASKDKIIKEQSDAINYLKNELNEINLLNAKLLFTNRLLKEHNITYEQKMDIVEMFDLSKTIREVKMNYATASKFLGISKPATSASKKSNISAAKVQTITEGLDRNVANSNKPSQTNKEIISDETYDKARFQELAGIKLAKKK